jgi:hypothetical protein
VTQLDWHAGSAGASVRAALEQRRDELVAGYSRERDDFLEEMLPEVALPSCAGPHSSTDPLTFTGRRTQPVTHALHMHAGGSGGAAPL